MLSRKNKIIVMKFVSLFSVIRGYNILVVILAQYLSTIFILAPTSNTLSLVLDFGLFCIVFASTLAIASGYIINNFYDSKKDLINRPNKSMLDRLVSQKTKLYVYFSLNFIIVALAYKVSWRAFFFFSSYIFLIWYYSHRVKKLPLIGNLTSAILSLLPFFAIVLYFKNANINLYGHALFLFLLLLMRELIKDLENIKGDLATNYKTIPIVYGEAVSKKIITVLTITTILPVYFLIELNDVGYMDIYFYLCLIFLVFFLLNLWKSKTKQNYLALHNLLKFLIVAGVFCITLIKPSVLLNGVKLLF